MVKKGPVGVEQKQQVATLKNQSLENVFNNNNSSPVAANTPNNKCKPSAKPGDYQKSVLDPNQNWLIFPI